MVYLESFHFPTFEEEDDFLAEYWKSNPFSMNKSYPFNVLSMKGLHSLDFQEITILYGGNGSGKSTALNLISDKLGLVRNSAYNKGDFHNEYLRLCDYNLGGEWDEYTLNIKDRAVLITSDDIFKYMLDTRQKNGHVRVHRSDAINDWFELRKTRVKHIDFETGEGVEDFNQARKARRQSCAQYVRENLGNIEASYSNGETGFMRFIESIVPDKLYILDEPENSLSCELQLELAKYIEGAARYYNCQFIIATHSPFLLSLNGAKIYNLDGAPATVSKFWELPNMRLYYELFQKYEGRFT